MGIDAIKKETNPESLDAILDCKHACAVNVFDGEVCDIRLMINDDMISL